MTQGKNNITDWCELPTQYGIFRMYDTGDENIKLVSFGDIHRLTAPVLVRMHSSCAASEIFGALDCDCDDQLKQSMKLTAHAQQGLIIHITQEGRGHGLSDKIKACSLMQTQNITTAESFEKMNLAQDVRQYDAVVELLKSLNIRKIKLITNNPRKYDFLQSYFQIEQVTLKSCIRLENLPYLISKKQQLNHQLSLEGFIAADAPIYFYDDCGIYAGFSNFSNHSLFIEGRLWQTSEHYYQTQKFNDEVLRNQIYHAPSPMTAKNIANAHRADSKHDWKDSKQAVMYKALQHKFDQHESLKNLLLATKEREIYEYSEQDRYWGDNGTGEGQNHLGKIIMRLRSELRG